MWSFVLKILFTYFERERKVGRKRGRETSMCGCLLHPPPLLGTWPATLACALTGTWTSDPLVLRLAPNPLSHTSKSLKTFFFFLRFYLFIVRKRGREGERREVKHQCVVASHTLLTGDLACNPGVCPDWELNRQCLGSQACAQSTKLHQPGLKNYFD